MGLSERIIEHELPYRLWQAPFAEDKFSPVLAHNDLARVRRVLDVGCGPGTNTHHFMGADYLGLDCNRHYIESARRRHRRNFVVADVTCYQADVGERFDFILVNSFLHHIDTPNARRILAHLSGLLAEDGHVHILELVLPNRLSPARFLARMDRGEFPRPIEEWRAMFSQSFEPICFEPYPLKALGTTLWNMVYFKGRKQQ
ncbi:MAG TPA: class I SAM-dependent methyltransferase [Terriglobia bacterium]|jgi:SAM-dependent methyltransferase|nr:class I SAM-dependent methyltransferase [Terriglobia bacterium]